MVKQVLPPHSSGKASAGPASAAKVRSASATASPIAARVKRMAAQSSTSGKRMPTAATNAAARAATARATSTTKKSRPTAGTKSQPVVPVQRKSSRKLHHEEAIAAVDDDLSADISSEERDDGDDGSDADSVDADHLDSADDRHASLDSDFEARSKHMPVVANSDSDSDVDDIYAPHRVAADSKGKGKAVVTPASAKAKGKPVTPASQKLKSKVASPASGKMTSKVATPMSGKMTSKVASPASQKTTSKAATPASATQNRTIKVKSVITDPDSDDTDSESDDVSPHTRRRMRVTARQEKVPSVDHSTALRQVAAAAAAFKPAVGLVSVEMPPRSTRSPHKATASDVRRAMATTRDDVSPRSKSVRADASAIAAAVSQSHASQSHGDSSAEPAPAGPSRVRRPPVITEHAFAHYMVPRKLKLFVGVDGDPMLFVLAKVSAVESIRKTIQQHGGRVVTVSDPSLTEEDMGRLIPLADKPHGIDPALREDFGDTFFSTRFVMDCIAADCVLDLDDYIFEADGVMPALDVAGRDVNESPSATSSRPASVATAAGAGAANAAASSSLIDNALDFINRNQLATMDFALFEKGGRRPGRNPWTAEEDYAIILLVRYVLEYDRTHPTGGQRLKPSGQKLFSGIAHLIPKHTPQSTRERYKVKIAPTVAAYGMDAAVERYKAEYEAAVRKEEEEAARVSPVPRSPAGVVQEEDEDNPFEEDGFGYVPDYSPPPQRAQQRPAVRPVRQSMPQQQSAASSQRPAVRPVQQSMSPQRPAVRPVQQPVPQQQSVASPQRPAVRPVQQSMSPQRPAVRPVQQTTSPQRPAVRPVQQSTSPQRPAVRPVQQSSMPQQQREPATTTSPHSSNKRKLDHADVLMYEQLNAAVNAVEQSIMHASAQKKVRTVMTPRANVREATFQRPSVQQQQQQRQQQRQCSPEVHWGSTSRTPMSAPYRQVQSSPLHDLHSSQLFQAAPRTSPGVGSPETGFREPKTAPAAARTQIARVQLQEQQSPTMRNQSQQNVSTARKQQQEVQQESVPTDFSSKASRMATRLGVTVHEVSEALYVASGDWDLAEAVLREGEEATRASIFLPYDDWILYRDVLREPTTETRMPLYFANALGSKQEAKYKDVNAMIKARGTEAVQERLQFLSEGKRWEQESSRRSSSGMRRSLA